MHLQELVLDGVSYELNGHSSDGEQFTGRWRCQDCNETDGVSILAESLEDALELARFSLFAHHQICHTEVVKCPQSRW